MDTTNDTELYAGSDLANAVDRSRAVWPRGLSPADRGPLLPRPELSQWRLTRRRLEGRDRAGNRLGVELVGVERSESYFLRHLFADVSRRHADPDCDLRITDYPIPLWLPGRRPVVRCLTPVWVAQSVELNGVWPDYLARLGRKRTKEIARLVRKTQPALRIESGETALDQFYRQLYVPFARSRFGADAALLTWPAFLDRFRRSAVLTMQTARGTRAANLLSRAAPSRLDIDKSGQTPGAESGLADLLDYFTLVYAAGLGCRQVGFGASRGHLDDGPLRYKAKWFARIDPAPRFKRLARIDVLRDSPASRQFLKTNRFIQCRRGKFFVRPMTVDQPSAADLAVASKLGLDTAPGRTDSAGHALGAEYERHPALRIGNRQ